ncbi:hypothetical protein AB0J74_21220 [Asanoa sp. NPDC049573]|uniref:hypothetical protein n=1 Tax=Asanoa sp. NPDC049573 TaxID=3155396 RepID=UPI003418EC45
MQPGATPPTTLTLVAAQPATVALSAARPTTAAAEPRPTRVPPPPSRSAGAPLPARTASVVIPRPDPEGSLTVERQTLRTAPPQKPQLAPAPTGPAVIHDAIVGVAVKAAVVGAERSAMHHAARQGARRDDPMVLPTATAIVPSAGSSVPGTGGGNGGTDPPATGMAVGSVLLIGVGLIAAGVALVGLRNRRDPV